MSFGRRVTSLAMIGIVATSMAGCGKEKSTTPVDLGLPSSEPTTATATITPSATPTTTAPRTPTPGPTPKGWKPAETPEDKEIFEVNQRYQETLIRASGNPATFRQVLKPVASEAVIEQTFKGRDAAWFSKGRTVRGEVNVYSTVYQRESKYVILRFCADSSRVEIVDSNGAVVDRGELEQSVAEMTFERLDGRWIAMGGKRVEGTCSWS